MALKYVTTLDFANVLNIKKDIPGWEVGVNPSPELVGTGDGTATIFYLDQNNIISNTQSLFYGATSSVTTPLVESTHYAIELDKGKITLNTAGTTAVGTSNIYGEYSYPSLSLSDSYIQTVLERAESKVDNDADTVFADGTTATPSYLQQSNEKQEGKGGSNRDYYSNKYPIVNLSTELSATAATSATTYFVDSTKGFATAGIFGISSDKITYTGKNPTAFTGCTGAIAAHDSGSDVLSYVVEISSSAGGTTPSWAILQKDIDFDLNPDSGRINLFRSDNILSSSTTSYPPQHTKNRFRMSYLSGWNTIPNLIKRAVLIAAKHMLVNDTMSRSLIQGRDEFRPSIIDAEKREYDDIIARYESTKIDNT